MSKRKVQEILRLAAAGKWSAVDSLLPGVDRSFIVRRLDHWLSQDPPPEGARALADHLAKTAPRDVPPALEGVPNDAAVEVTSTVEEPRDIHVQEIVLDSPAAFLAAVGSAPRFRLQLDQCRIAQVWGLVGLAALCRRNGAPRSELRLGEGRVSRFATALGVSDVIEGRETRAPAEKQRSVPLRRVRRFEEIEGVASEVSLLILPDEEEEDTRRTIYYVLVELLRNVVQHSQDPLGGVAAAQLMTAAQQYEHEAVQVAVCDAGIGIFKALRGFHSDLAGAREALEKALWPHYSGTFAEGLTGTQQNAGMGLFFIAEMAKRTGGRLLIATRGAALVITGDQDDVTRHKVSFVEPDDLGFPGTLVSFELPLGRVPDHAGLLAAIHESAKNRTPQRAVHRWIHFDESLPDDIEVFIVAVAAEDTVAAERFAEMAALRLMSRRAIALDFRDVPICTQSYLHALLYEPLRIAWARQTPIHVLNAQPAVRSGLELLERYALGG